MREMIKRLIAERAATIEKQRALLDAVEAEKRDLSTEESATFDAQNLDVDTLTDRIGELETILARNKDADAQREQYGAALNNDGETREILLDAPDLRTQFRDLARGHTEDGALVNEVVLDMSGISVQSDRETGRYQVRDLTVGTAAKGGDTVPTSMAATLWEHMIEDSAIRQTNVTQLRTTSGEPLEVPKTTAHSTGAKTDEASVIGESDPAFGKVTLNAYKYGAVVQISLELLDDSGVNIEGYLGRELGAAIGNASGKDFISGNGTNKPNGIVGASTLGVTGATSVVGVFSADNLIDLQYSVIAKYANRGWWLMRRASEGAMRKMKGTDNHYLWAPGLVLGAPNTLLGRPIVTDPNVAATATSAKSVLFGDFSRYMIRDVGGITVRKSDDFAFTSDLATFKATIRTDGDLIDVTGAVKHFAGGAS